MLTNRKNILHEKYCSARGAMFYFLPAPFWIAAFFHLLHFNLSGMGKNLVVAALISYAGKLTLAHFRAPAPSLDNRPLAAACLLTAVVIFCHFVLGRSGKLSFGFGLLAVVGYCLLYFGKGKEKSPSAAQKQAIIIPNHLSQTLKNMLFTAYQAIESLENNAATLSELRNEKRLGFKLSKVAHKAREIIKQIDHSPDHIRTARPFLVVHLAELAKISTHYLYDVERPNHDEQRKNFYHLLCESEAAFGKQHTDLINQQQEQLDIQIQVLREQLKQDHSDEQQN